MNPTSQELAAAREILDCQRIQNLFPSAPTSTLNVIATIIHKHNDWKAKQSELMHKKFFFQPHPDDPKKCNCAYCARDFEAVAEHAAYLEMDVHSLEQQRDQLSARVMELEGVIQLVGNYFAIQDGGVESVVACSEMEAAVRSCLSSTTATSTRLQDLERKAKALGGIKYYEIIGGHTGEAIGHCTSDGLEEAKRDEPSATFVEISLSQYESAMKAQGEK